MGRPLLIVALVGLFTISGVAIASPGEKVRLPVPVGPAIVAGAGTHVVVERGDHLWKISAEHLGDTSPAGVAPYWRRVVAINTPTLRSGDPDLIYPGEEIELPPLNERP